MYLYLAFEDGQTREIPLSTRHTIQVTDGVEVVDAFAVGGVSSIMLVQQSGDWLSPDVPSTEEAVTIEEARGDADPGDESQAENTGFSNLPPAATAASSGTWPPSRS